MKDVDRAYSAYDLVARVVCTWRPGLAVPLEFEPHDR